DAGRPGGGGVHLAQPVHQPWVGLLGGQAAADDHDIRCGELVEAGGCDELAAAGVVGDRPGLGGHEHSLVPGDVGEHLEGPDDVQGGEPRVQHEGDRHRLGLLLAASTFGRCTVCVCVGHVLTPSVCYIGAGPVITRPRPCFMVCLPRFGVCRETA